MNNTTDTNEKLKREQDKTNPRNDFRWGSLAGLIIGLILLAIGALVAHHGQLSGWQLDVFRAINNLSDSLKTPATIITNALGAVYPIIAVILISLLFKKWRIAWRFFVTIGGALVVSEVVKKIINEARPGILLHGDLHMRAIESGPGFPSNHTTAATAMALTLWFLLPKKWRFLSLIWIIVVAFSRVYLGVHSPVDVVGGFGVGLAAVCFIRLLPRKIAKPLKLDY